MLLKSKVAIGLYIIALILLASLTSFGATINYTYDNLNRLTKVDYGNGFTEEYIYDAAGNRLSFVVNSPTPDISVLPMSHNFGSVTVGSTSSAQTFTISNTGTADLDIGTIALTGTNAFEFSKRNDTCSGQTVASNGNCTFDVVFSPTSAGAKSANLVIPSNDYEKPIVNVSLIGTGVLPLTIGYNPTSFSFNATYGGSNPPNQSLIISNAGGGTLSWSVSDNATWLNLSPTNGTNSGTVTVSVNIAGLIAGTYNATITITALGATNSPVEIPVTLIVEAADTTPPTSTITAPAGMLRPLIQTDMPIKSGGE